MWRTSPSRGSSRGSSRNGRAAPGHLKRFAAENRDNATPAVRLLVGCLRSMSTGFVIFTEHALTVGGQGFLLDIFFPALGLAIEVDGGSHRGREHRDISRDAAILQAHGIVTFRVRNGDVFYQRQRVLDGIAEAIRQRAWQLGYR